METLIVAFFTGALCGALVTLLECFRYGSQLRQIIARSIRQRI